LGDTAPDTDIPVVYRAIDDGTTFSLYIKNNRGYFTVGDSEPAVTPEFDAFGWIALTGTYDGVNVKIYLNGDEIEPALPFTMDSFYDISSGTGLFIGKSETGAFKGLIDEVRIFNIALGNNHINNSGGNGNPAENFPSSIAEYLTGQWSFDQISQGNLLYDLSENKNHLYVTDITEIFPSKNLPYIVVRSVSDEADASPGDGNAASLNGQVTLRSAIEETNALPGAQIIYFYINEADPVIQPLTALPPVTDPVILDGTFQKGYPASAPVQVDGSFGGINITAGGSSVKGLDINNTSGYSLSLSAGDANIIEANRISGLSINSGSNQITNNTFSNSNANGISIGKDAVDNQIAGNEIKDNSGYGIIVTNADGNEIRGNRLSLNGTGGISVSNSSVLITANSVTENTGAGILLNAADGNTLSQNMISGNTAEGVVINGNNNVVNQDTVTENAGHGIVINGSENDINYSHIYDNGISGTGVGVLVASGNSNSILYNSIYDNRSLGIQLSDLANDSQGYPVLNTFYSWQDENNLLEAKGGTAVQGVLNATDGEYYKIQFFANASSDNREGRRYLGEITVTPDIAGSADFLANFKDVIVEETESVSATATKLDGGSDPLSTSEFSASVSILFVNSSTTSVFVKANAAPQQKVFKFQSTGVAPKASISDSIWVGFSNCFLPVTFGGLVIRQP